MTSVAHSLEPASHDGGFLVSSTGPPLCGVMSNRTVTVEPSTRSNTVLILLCTQFGKKFIPTIDIGSKLSMGDKKFLVATAPTSV